MGGGRMQPLHASEHPPDMTRGHLQSHLEDASWQTCRFHYLWIFASAIVPGKEFPWMLRLESIKFGSKEASWAFRNEMSHQGKDHGQYLLPWPPYHLFKLAALQKSSNVGRYRPSLQHCFGEKLHPFLGEHLSRPSAHTLYVYHTLCQCLTIHS